MTRNANIVSPHDPDTTRIGYWEVAAKTGELYWSDEVYQIHGLAPSDEIDVEAALNAYHPDDRDRVAEYVSRALEEKEDFQFKLRLIKADGEVRHVLATGVVRLNSDGDVQSVFGIFEDITDRKKMEDVLRASEENFRQVVEQAGDAMFIIDPSNARFVDVNAEACTSLGYSRSELLELSVPDIDPEFSIKKFEDLVTTFKQGQAITLESVHHRKDAIEFPVEIRSGLIDLRGVPKLLAFVRDISERKRAEEALLKSHDDLERAVNDRTQELRQSEKRFRDYSETASDVYWELDRNLRYTMVHPSDELAAIFPVAMFLGKSRASVKPDGVEDGEWQSHLDDLEARRPFRNFVQPRPLDDGRIIWVSVSGKPIFNDHGAFEGYRGTASDITELKTVQSDLVANRSLLSNLLKTTQQGYWQIDNDGRTVDTNPAMCELLGRSREYILGKTIYDFVDEKNKQILEDQLGKRGKGESSAYELELIRSGGSTFSCINAATPIYDESGHKMGSIGLFTDISQQKHAEKKLLESQQNFKEVAELAAEWFWERDADGLLTFVSEGLERTTGIKPEQILGKPRGLMMVRVRGDETNWNEHQQAVARREAFRNFQACYRRPNGSLGWVNTSANPIFDDSGQFCGYRGASTDITEQKEVERIKSEFISTVSHELRTPLTSIMGALGLLKSDKFGPLTQAALDILKVAQKNSDRLFNLVSDILDVERLSSGAMEFDFQPLNLNPLVAEIVDENVGLAKEYDVRFMLSECTGATTVQGDRDRLAQVINNLLSNSVKFSPHGSVINIQITRHDQRIKISITDNGPGIPAETHSKIFEKFSQLDSSDTREKGGSGLGLNISRSIVEKHGGTIGLDSTVGVGSTFYFTLPALK